MAMRYLGERFELHTGGVDNVFPHHEDEIAQSQALTGQVPAASYVHGEHLLMSGRKMAKSAGNFQRITDLADEGVDPLAFRYLCLTAQYGHKLDFSTGSLRAASAALDSLRARLHALGPAPVDGPWAMPPVLVAGSAGPRPEGVANGVRGHQAVPDVPLDAHPVVDRAHAPGPPLSDAAAALHRRFVEALDRDLDMPAALATIRETLRAPLDDDERRWLVLDADAVLGFDLHATWDAGREPRAAVGPVRGRDDRSSLPPRAAALLDERATARTAGDYARSDRLRDDLSAMGVEVMDRPGGLTEWRIRGR